MSHRYALLLAVMLMSATVHASNLDDALAGYKRLQRFDAQDAQVQALIVDVSSQRLYLFEAGRLKLSYPISTATAGIGNKAGSNKTPLGIHRVRTKIGDGAPSGTIFRARVNTHRLATIIQTDAPADADYVTSRILWLDGQEDGINRGPGIDSYERYIYIHGTAEEGRIGRPASHGCVRMTNPHVIHLFDRVPVGALVLIQQ